MHFDYICQNVAFKMHEIGDLIRRLRLERGYPLRKVAAYLDIDQAILSKMERGLRKISKEQVIKLAKFFNYDEKELLLVYLSDRIILEIGEDELAREALQVAEEKLEYTVQTVPDREKTIDMISEIISQFPKVKKAWIYGSFSRMDDGPSSDIDIALEADKETSYFDLADIQYQLENQLKRKFDVGFIDSFRQGIYKSVLKDMQLVYERSPEK